MSHVEQWVKLTCRAAENHLFGFKTEVPKLPLGVIIGSSVSYTGATAVVAIFRPDKTWQIIQLHRFEDEADLQDVGEKVKYYPNSWILLMHKACTGAKTEIRAVVPAKNSSNGWL